MTLLGIDTETCGLDDNSSLLTINFTIFNDQFEIPQIVLAPSKILEKIGPDHPNAYLDYPQLDLKVKPEPINGRTSYNGVQMEAFAVNKINLAKHDKEAITYKQASTKIYNWLLHMYNRFGYLVPFGNNIQDDIDKITSCCISKKAFENHTDRRVIDLLAIGQTLKLMGKIPETQSLALGKIAEYFEIEVDSDRVHSADYDVLLALSVYKKFCELMK